MQTTLLGFAFAIILALLAALIGPFFVDWTQFRPTFEAEASRVIGLPVHVTGAIDARVLPSPSLTLHGLEIGGPKPEQTIRARQLSVEFALGPLIRGEFRAVQAQLAGPDVTVAIDAAGSLELPKLSVKFVPDSLSIERLNIEDGRVHVVNAVTGNRTTFDKVWFNGDLRSLAGPFKGEGAFVSAGKLYGYRIAAGRLDDEGRLRLRLSLDPSDRLLTAEADGALTLGSGKPRFEGTVALSRPAGLVTATGQSKVNPPWRVTSRVNIGAAGAKLERIDFLYGAEDNGVRLTGTANLRFGRQPRFKAVLSARQLDLDRLIATPDKPMRLPADALKTLIARYSGVVHAPIPVALSISADTITLGGAPIQLFGADVQLGDDAWTLDRVEFRAPGLSQVSLSGRLALTPSVGFRGPVSIETNAPNALAGWLDGQSDPATRVRPFKARGDVVLDSHEIGVEHLKAEIDHKAVDGRLRYAAASGGKPSRLDAELSAPELDVDALLAFSKAALSGTAWQPPSEVTLALAVDRARIAGVEAKTVQVQLKRDANLLQVDRLSVADLGGARVSATGRVDTSGSSPRGHLALDLEARDLDGMIALAEKFAPAAAKPLRRAAARLPQAKLKITLGLDGPAAPEAGAKTRAAFAAEGQIAGLRASLHGEAQQDSAKTASDGLTALIDSDVRIEAQMDGEDSATLVALLGLDKAVAVQQSPGFVNVAVTGKVNDALHVEGRILAGGLDGKASGTMRLGNGWEPSADLRLDIAGANIRPLVGASARAAALPLTLHGRVALTGQRIKLTDLKATLAGSDLRGALAFDLAPRVTVAGEIEADTLDAAAVIATAIGAPPAATTAQRQPAGWSAEPYRAAAFAGIDGRVDLRVMRAALTPSLSARQLRTALVFHGAALTLEDFTAHVGGGRVTGHLSLRHGADGLAVRGQINLAKIDAAAVQPSDARPVVNGRLSAKLDLAADGLSPKALIGSLTGTGTVSLDDGALANLNPKAFDAIVRASDRGLAAGTPKIHDIVSAALDSGDLRIPRIETAVTINAGQVRPANAVVEADGTELAAAGSFDLVQQRMDVRLTLSGPAGDGSSGRPDIFIALKGPVSTPQRHIDVSALAGWLTIRRIDQQAKKLEALEAAARAREAARAQEPSIPQTPQASAPLAAAPAESPVAVAPTSVSPDAPPVLHDQNVSRRAAPEAASSASIAAPSAIEEHPATPSHPKHKARPEHNAKAAPPLPAPLDIRRIPRGPDRAHGLATEKRRPSAPRSQPSFLDSLIGPSR